MKKLLIVSMLGLGLLTQATEQEQQDQAVLAESAKQAVAMQDTNQTDETSAHATEVTGQDGDQKKLSSPLIKQYVAGFLFGTVTGAGSRMAGMRIVGGPLLIWIVEPLLRQTVFAYVRDEKEHQKAKWAADGVYKAARLGSWLGYLATICLNRPEFLID